MTFHDLTWPSMIFYDLLSLSKTSMTFYDYQMSINKPWTNVRTSPVQPSLDHFSSNLRLDPIDFKSSCCHCLIIYYLWRYLLFQPSLTPPWSSCIWAGPAPSLWTPCTWPRGSPAPPGRGSASSRRRTSPPWRRPGSHPGPRPSPAWPPPATHSLSPRGWGHPRPGSQPYNHNAMSKLSLCQDSLSMSVLQTDADICKNLPSLF